MKTAPIIFVTSLVACAHSGTTMDAATTGAALSRGATEAGPVAGLHPTVMPVTFVARAYYLAQKRGDPDCIPAVRVVSGVGWGAAAGNMLAAFHFTLPVTLPVGMIAGVFAQYAMKEPARHYCRLVCRMDDVPAGAVGARCENGTIVVLIDNGD